MLLYNIYISIWHTIAVLSVKWWMEIYDILVTVESISCDSDNMQRKALPKILFPPKLN